MQNDKKECSGGVCDKKTGDKECAGGVCDKSGQKQVDLNENKTDFKQTDTTKDLRQGQDIPQSNTLGQDMQGVRNVGKETNPGEKHLPTNTAKTGVDNEVSAAGKFDR